MKATERKFKELRQLLTGMEGLVVAFSGGVDSTLLLKVAGDILGDRVLAVTAKSRTVPRREIESSVKLAGDLGIAHRIFESDELDIPEFASNPNDKCYICKKRRFSGIIEFGREKGFSIVADGSNVDDREDYRPGMKALLELGVRSPLSEAGLSKAEIRELSRGFALPTWDKPAYACLASRIPYGMPITAEKLDQVDACEEFIRDLGFQGQVRVRHYGDTARVEVEADAIAKLAEDPVRQRIVHHFKRLGFEFITLDLAGYSMGSLNRAIGR